MFAIEDFSSPASMTQTTNSLQLYLYGFDYDWTRDGEGKLVMTPKRLDWHVWGQKKVEAGFFRLPESEQVSAVLFSNSGTIAEFARMGMLAGFGSNRVEIIRSGLWMNPDPNAVEPLRTTTSPRPRVLGELVRGHLSLSQPSGPQAP